MGAPDPAVQNTSTRRYRSPRREQQARRTRVRIIEAATGRFLAHGYPATTIRAVAADAGVSVPTVELAFGTKARLLKAAIDAAIAGDDEPVPMLAREWVARAQAATEPAVFAAVFAQVFTDSARRAAGLTLAALEAARVDDDIAVVAAQLMTQRQTMATWLVDGLLQRSPLRDVVGRAAAVDTVWALMDPGLFCRLTQDRQWSPTRFRRWFTDSVIRLLLPVPGAVTDQRQHSTNRTESEL
jgi:AcrR family transcriptional regulator